MGTCISKCKGKPKTSKIDKDSKVSRHFRIGASLDKDPDNGISLHGQCGMKTNIHKKYGDVHVVVHVGEQ